MVSLKFNIFGRDIFVMAIIKSVSVFLRRHFPWLLLAVWFVLQVPFLGADPDSLVDIHTRGAWTDEGLYSGTARNFINTSTIEPYADSLFLRGPLFTMAQIPFFFLFGQSLLVARLMVLLLTLFTFWLFLRKEETRLAGVFLLAVGFTQFHLFHFSHYAMAEMFSTCLILISLLLMIRAYRTEQQQRGWIRNMAGAALLLFLAYGMKIQFLYIAFLLPGFALAMTLPGLFSQAAEHRLLRRKFLFAVLFTAAGWVIYALLWYLPHFEFYNYVMAREVDGRYHTTLFQILDSARFNFTELLFVSCLKPLIVTGGIALVAGLSWLIIRPGSWRQADQFLFILALLWFIGELHKVPMTYMPHRYLVSAYASVSLMIAVFFTVVCRSGKTPAVITLLAALILAGWQLTHTKEAFHRRTYDLKAVNLYLKQYDWKGETISGAWGPSVTWGTRAKVFPVWYGFVNDFRALDARMIITEGDQDDSDRSLIMQGIDLSAHTDSVRHFPIWRYHVELHWLHTP